MKENREKAEAILRRLERLARSKVNDTLRLAYLKEEDIDRLEEWDLTALTEFKRSANGTVEIKLVDRAALLERIYQLLKEDERETGKNAADAALWKALTGDESEC